MVDMHEIKCESCDVRYIGQSGRKIKAILKEHENSIKGKRQFCCTLYTEYRIDSKMFVTNDDVLDFKHFLLLDVCICDNSFCYFSVWMLL